MSDPVLRSERRRGRRRATIAGAVALIVLGAAGVSLLAMDEIAVPAALAAVAAATASLTVAIWARDVVTPERIDEPRHVAVHDDEEPVRMVSRRTLLRTAAAAAVATGSVAVFVAIAAPDARRRFTRTAWTAGAALVTGEGRPVRAGQLRIGEIVTVWPEGHVGDADSQVVLLRIDDELQLDGGRGDWAPDGQIAFSKVCTHMGCPVGLFDTERHLLVCPCHQATFDVLDGAAPVFGPAPRPLPQLPLTVGDDGILRARSDFREAVGPGFWERPR